MLSKPRHADQLTDETYIDFVRSVFRTMIPTTIMGFLFIAVAAFAAVNLGDRWVTVLGIAGTGLSLTRTALLIAVNRRLRRAANLHVMSRIERSFATCYLAFAIVLGLLAFRIMTSGADDLQLVVAVLVVGYAAGVAAGVALRPWIGISALALSVLPLAAASASIGDAAHLVLTMSLLLFLVGGISSLLSRYRLEIDKARMRQTLASLAQRDALTGLDNRLSLEKSLFDAANASDEHAIGLHYVDLDRFKQVNDVHGHLVGDYLLREVAMRLRSVCGEAACAVRLGGDEFVVLQPRILHDDEAELMARRIVRSLSEAFLLNGSQVRIGASVGYVVSQSREASLDALLQSADRALYSVKHAGGGGASMALRAAVG